MRAVQIKGGKGPVENLYIGTVPDPVPKENEVLVKIKAFGLNRMDIFQREGEYPVPPGVSEILGVEFSGIVSKVGNGVSRWKIGDEVLGLVGGGAYAEYVIAPETHLMSKPASMSRVDAASIPEAFLTAFQAIILYGELKKGEDVLVHAAASGVGIASIQIARVLGAATVTATASKKEKLDWLLSIPNGATHVVNYRTTDFSEEIQKTTSGKGVDVVVDFVGQSYWHKNISCMAKDGRMTILWVLSGGTVEKVDLLPLLYKRLRILGSTLRSRSAEYQTMLMQRMEKEILSKITGESGDGPIKTYVHKVYRMEQIQDAQREMETNQNIGKIMVEVD